MKKLNQFSHYFFDSDGTMMDTEEMIYICFAETCQHFGGFTPSRDDVKKLIGIPFRPQAEHYLGPLSDETYKEVRRFFKAHQDGIYKDHVRLFPKIKSTLKTLKDQGKTLAVVSSRTRASLNKYLEETDIAQYFDLIVSPECTEKHKPHAEPVEYGLEKLQGRPEETLFIGDALFDIQSGRSAGTHTALVSWGPSSAEELETKPHYILEDMDQLL